MSSLTYEDSSVNFTVRIKVEMTSFKKLFHTYNFTRILQQYKNVII